MRCEEQEGYEESAESNLDKHLPHHVRYNDEFSTMDIPDYEKYRLRHPERYSKLKARYTKKTRQKLRAEIISLLGGCCCNPYGQHKEPYTDIRALQIDLIKGGHSQRMFERYCIRCSTNDDYRRIRDEIKQGSKEYQCLCANCNWIKRGVNHEV